MTKSHQAEIDQLLSKDVSFPPSNPEKGNLGKDMASAEGQTPKASHCFIAHTPGPWRAINGYVFAGKSCIAICDTDNASPARFDANAAFIVRACNAHDDLLAALKAALSAVELPTGIGIGIGGLEFRFPAWVEKARAAIAKAESQS